MITLANIRKKVKNLIFDLKKPSVIMMNELDYLKLKEKTNLFDLNHTITTILGLRLIVIPYYLEDKNFLKIGKCLIFEEEYIKFLKEKLENETK